jgi:5-oxoprolinase (ATP-hydrolysing) subunit A
MLRDLNCDMGELPIPWNNGRDRELLKYLTSVNVSCGVHAGSAVLIKATIKEALKLNLNIGAHPSFPDKENFGRLVMKIGLEDLRKSLQNQIGWLMNEVVKAGGILHHIKPHGALYNLAAKDESISKVICDVLLQLDSELTLFCSPNSALAKVAKNLNINTWRESFVDRQYHKDGSLVSRNFPNAVIDDVSVAIKQFELLKLQKVISIEGDIIPLISDTTCIHGDNAIALEIAQALNFRNI